MTSGGAVPVSFGFTIIDARNRKKFTIAYANRIFTPRRIQRGQSPSNASIWSFRATNWNLRLQTKIAGIHTRKMPTCSIHTDPPPGMAMPNKASTCAVRLSKNPAPAINRNGNAIILITIPSFSLRQIISTDGCSRVRLEVSAADAAIAFNAALLATRFDVA